MFIYLFICFSLYIYIYIYTHIYIYIYTYIHTHTVYNSSDRKHLRAPPEAAALKARRGHEIGRHGRPLRAAARQDHRVHQGRLELAAVPWCCFI